MPVMLKANVLFMNSGMAENKVEFADLLLDKIEQTPDMYSTSPFRRLWEFLVSHQRERVRGLVMCRFWAVKGTTAFLLSLFPEVKSQLLCGGGMIKTANPSTLRQAYNQMAMSLSPKIHSPSLLSHVCCEVATFGIVPSYITTVQNKRQLLTVLQRLERHKCDGSIKEKAEYVATRLIQFLHNSDTSSRQRRNIYDECVDMVHRSFAMPVALHGGGKTVIPKHSAFRSMLLEVGFPLLYQKGMALYVLSLVVFEDDASPIVASCDDELLLELQSLLPVSFEAWHRCEVSLRNGSAVVRAPTPMLKRAVRRLDSLYRGCLRKTRAMNLPSDVRKIICSFACASSFK